MPAPRRMTLASQKLSHRKLATPFRSPLVARPLSSQSTQVNLAPATPASSSKNVTQAVKIEATVAAMPASKPNVTKTLTTMALASRAAGQFRSPFAGHASSSGRGAILPTQTIQTLERRLTVLRRAVKIKRDDDENKLDVLAKKWREAGREAAYELWSIVREAAQTEENKNDGAWASGWGWDDDQKVKTEEDSEQAGGGAGTADYAQDVEKETEAEETIGLMLRRLGIAPETLGWDDKQENFVDD
ncbi:hypothetical protein DENSPDRAFT_12310 [Dentipellis sp. KUC8613]|nr:hypothetical protein DENSPDRAFT_12310 [Dentipellis sp. KUC8613]